MGVARLGASPVAGSGWLGKWQVTNGLPGDQQARQVGVGSSMGRLSQEGMSVVSVVLLAARGGRPRSPFSAYQAGGPLWEPGWRLLRPLMPGRVSVGLMKDLKRLAGLAGPGAQA